MDRLRLIGQDLPIIEQEFSFHARSVREGVGQMLSNRCGFLGRAPSESGSLHRASIANLPLQLPPVGWPYEKPDATHAGIPLVSNAFRRSVRSCLQLAVRNRDLPATPVLELLRGLSAEDEWQGGVSQIEKSLAANMTVADFVRAAGLERGVTGYSLHVVPVAIYAWLRHHGDFRTALISVLDCGGDTDTVGAILGALTGAATGKSGISADWRAGIFEWPRSISFMERIAVKLAEQKVGQRALGTVRYFWPGLLPRNLLFVIVVLFHGFSRLAFGLFRLVL